MVNIDGYYEYKKKKNSLRKNKNGSQRCPAGSSGPGVDINRNFPSKFGTIKESRDPCG